MKLWVDIDNPPQVQYLLPLRDALAASGGNVAVTARDYGITLELLRDRGVSFEPVGSSFGRSKWDKVAGTLERARALVRLFGDEPPAAVVCASRSAALAARRMRIPSFVLADYEYVHVALLRLTGSVVLYPDVIDGRVFRRRGLRKSQLVPYRGLKEDLTFSGVSFNGGPPPAELADLPHDLPRVLFRPPAEESHYYTSSSGRIALRLLSHLAGREDAIVVFSPRYSWQREYVERLRWRTPPVVLDRAVPFLPLLSSVDAVVSSGGTMLREAAYLGVPSYSIFQGKTGGVDRYLASIGRLTFIASEEEFPKLVPTRVDRREPIAADCDLVRRLAETVLAATPNGRV